MKKHNATYDERLDKNSSWRETAGGAERPNEEDIRAWLISNISAVVEVDPQQIDIQKPFEHYGMDSMQAMRLSGDLEDWVGRQLSPTVVWDYPTIELLARHLVEGIK